MISGYHPREAQPQTRLVLMIDAAGAARFHATAVRALTEVKDRWTIGAGEVFTTEDGTCGCVLRRGPDLIFATSTLEIETFRTWAEALTIP